MLAYICKWVLVSALVVASQGATFTVENNCQYTVWPGILSNGEAQISTTGFKLQKGESRTINAPPSWTGRFWGRTLCNVTYTSNKRNFTCVTGDCGSNKVECSGGGPAPPATFLEFSQDGPNGTDSFEVNVFDGYNLPMLVVPQGYAGANYCRAAGCVKDLNGFCPLELQVSDLSGEVVGCTGPCCCTAKGTRRACAPTDESRLFKNACPRAFTDVYDDSSSFTCESGADYFLNMD
ncbi:hypothetical protein RJ640_013371 [Escallonia rubra]|uniref:Thaumatin-like protein n=1 Tax=Escallonia rubra TaxID=112253 RepID=A0AA88UHE9_9ASTE|nr:hypothetical protein RJ640_013371 [Escallonia rubra]